MFDEENKKAEIENNDDDVIIDEAQDDDIAEIDNDLENGDGEDGDENNDNDNGDDPEDEIIEVNFKSATPADDIDIDDENDTPVIKLLRKKVKDEAKAKRELEAKIAALEAKTEKKTPTLRAKPTIEDHDYDDEEFTTDLEKWLGEKRADDARKKERQDLEQSQQEAYEQRRQGYYDQKAALNIPDFDEGEALVKESLNLTQQSVIIEAANNPALVILALSQHPARLKALAAEKNPVRFAAQLARLEVNMKTPKRAKPNPDEIAR